VPSLLFLFPLVFFFDPILFFSLAIFSEKIASVGGNYLVTGSTNDGCMSRSPLDPPTLLFSPLLKFPCDFFLLSFPLSIFHRTRGKPFFPPARPLAFQRLSVLPPLPFLFPQCLISFLPFVLFVVWWPLNLIYTKRGSNHSPRSSYVKADPFPHSSWVFFPPGPFVTFPLLLYEMYKTGDYGN